MDASRQRRRGRRLSALLAIVVTGAALVVVPAQTVHADPPTNPSDTQLKNAQAAKTALAGKVGRLGAQIADLQGRIQRLDADAELAEQKLANALDQLARARDAAAAARARVDAAQAAVDKATQQFSDFVRTSYMNSPISGAAGSLLTATDPNEMLQRGDLVQYTAAQRLQAISGMNKATVEKSNADAAARAAVQRQTAATNAAQQAKQDADDALQAARSQRRTLNAQLSASQSALDTARDTLATLTHQRAVYRKWKHDQEVAAAKRRAAQAAAAAAARAAWARANRDNGGGGGGQDFAPPPAAPSSGGWTAAEGQTAVNRAMQYLGMPYAYAGGGFSGPSYGVCTDDDGWNDCHVYGFDCSGLVMYAWAPYVHYDHYAATQYWQAGSYHPSTSDLRPGDLVFWSNDGTQERIHHVAIYIGGGNVIQAPHSGDIVRITPLGDVGTDYFGATRPLT